MKLSNITNSIKSFFKVKRNVVLFSLITVFVVITSLICFNFDKVSNKLSNIVHDIKVSAVNVEGFEISTLIIDEEGQEYNDLFEWSATKYNDQKRFTYQINYKKTDPTKTYNANDLEIKVPSVYQLLDRTSYSYMIISADQFSSSQKNYTWSYYFTDRNSSTYLYETIILTNNFDIEQNANFEGSIRIEYMLRANEGAYSDVTKSFSAKLNNQIESNQIALHFSSNRSLYSARPSSTEINSYDGLPSGDYIWVKAYLYFKSDDGVRNIILNGTNSEHVVVTLPEDTILFSQDGNFVKANDSNYYYYSMSGSLQSYVYIGYPRSRYENSNVFYKAELYGIYEYEENADYELIATINENLNTSNFEFTYSGNLYSFSKGIDRNKIPSLDVNHIIDSVQNFHYSVNTIFTGNKYDLVIGDDVLFKKETNGNVSKLSDSDYKISTIHIGSRLHDGNGAPYTNASDYDMDVFVRHANSSEYVKYRDTSKLQPGEYININVDDIVGYYVKIYSLDKSFSVDTVDPFSCNIKFKNMNASVGDEIYNFAYLEVYNENSNTPLNTPPDSSYSSELSYFNIKTYDNNQYGRNMQRAYEYIKVSNTIQGINIRTSNNAAEHVDEDNFVFSGYIGPSALYKSERQNGSIAYNVTNDYRGYEIYELLPEGMGIYNNEIEISPNSLAESPLGAINVPKNIKKPNGEYFSDWDEYINTIKNYVTYEIIDNWKNTNRTLVKITLDLDDYPLDISDLRYVLDRVDYFEDYKLNYYVNKESLIDYGKDFTRQTYIKPHGVKYVNEPVGLYFSNYNTHAVKDTLDLNEDNDINEYLINLNTRMSVSYVTESNQDLISMVRTNKSIYTSKGAESSLNSDYTYKLRARNASNKITNLVIYDSLESYIKINGEYQLARGDNSAFKGTFQGVDTSFAQSKGYTVKVYYSENERPGSLGSDTSWRTYTEGTTDKTKVKSLAFEYYDSTGTNKAILPEDSLTYVEIKMKTPTNVVNDSMTTYNGSWVEWNALDSQSNIVPNVTGINSNTVSISLPVVLKVKHLIKGTSTALIPEETYEKYNGEEYTTSISDQIPNDYLYDSTEGDPTTGTISKAYTEVIYYYKKKEPILSSTINKTGTDNLTSRNNQVNYQITYNGTIKDFVGNSTLTIVDTLPYEIDTTKPYELNGGVYNANNKTITWNKTITSSSNEELSKSYTFNIGFSYKNIPVTITNITNRVTSTLTSDTKTSTAEKNKNTTISEQVRLVVHHYYQGTTNSISPDVITYHDGGYVYNTSPASVPADYDVITPTNASGTLLSDETVVTYYYVRKTPNLSSAITKTGTDSITSLGDTITYTITYKPTITDYIGSVSIKIVDILPYEIDTSKDYNLDGGVYNANNKTITWNNTFNKNTIASESKTYMHTISFVYKNINADNRGITNTVKGKTTLENKNQERTASYTTRIDVIGKIIVKYIDIETNEEIHEQVESQDIIHTNKFVPERYEIEKYEIVESPSEAQYEYEEQTQTLYFKYRKKRYKIITKVSGNGGTIKGDEEIEEGQDSTKDNIVIKAEEGYTIYKITINGKELSIKEGLTDYVVENFKDVRENKLVVVEFSKKSEKKFENPPTGTFTSIMASLTIIIGSILVYIYFKKKAKFKNI